MTYRPVLVAAMIVASIYAADTDAADPATAALTDAEVRTLLQVNGTADISSQIGPVAAQQLAIALHRASPNLPARADPIITDVVVSYLRRQADRDHVAERLIPIYRKYLTREDVKQLTQFYQSPVGRKLVQMSPAISLESAKVGEEWMESILPGLRTELYNRLRAEKLIE